MSRKDDPIGEALGVGIGAVILLGKLGWKALSALSGGAIAAADKAREVNLEKEIQRQKPPYYFDQRIAAVRCIHCGVDNEQGFEICYNCGELAPARPNSLIKPVKPTPMPSWVWGFLVILGVCVFCVVIANLQSVNRGSGPNYQPTSTYKYVYVNRGATATVKAEATLAAGGVLPTATPRPPTRTPWPTYTPTNPLENVNPVFHQYWEQMGDLGSVKDELKTVMVIEQPMEGGKLLLFDAEPLTGYSKVYAFMDDTATVEEFPYIRFIKGVGYATPTPAPGFFELYDYFGLLLLRVKIPEAQGGWPPLFRLGYATGPYQQFQVTVHNFEKGRVLHSDKFGIDIIYSDHSWKHIDSTGEEAAGTPEPSDPRPTKPPAPTSTPDLIQMFLGKLIEAQWETEVAGWEFENGVIAFHNAREADYLNVEAYVLYNDHRWQLISHQDLIQEIDNPTRLVPGYEINGTLFRPAIAAYALIGGQNSDLGKPLKYFSGSHLESENQQLVIYEDGILLTVAYAQSSGSYILYNSGQWIESDEVSSNNPSSIEQSTAAPNSAVTPSNQVQSSPPTNCKYPVNPEFFNLWGGQLGCPVEPEKVVPFGADQPMQGGYLFWREDTNGVYVIYDRNKQTGEELFEGEWFPSPGKWNGVDACIVNKASPPNTPPMVRGFSWLWCQELGGPDGKLGWPLAEEQGRQNTFRTQAFENGLIWIGSNAKVYALFYNNTFLARRF